MASTYTTNLAVEKPGSGDYVGTWDTVVNANMGIFDSAVGTMSYIDLSGGSVTLSTAQARSAILKFYGSLPGFTTVTIPGLSSSPGTIISGKQYTIINTAASSQFYVTLATTVAGSRVIALPADETVTAIIEDTNSNLAGSMRFANLGRVGSYVDTAVGGVYGWVSGCTVPPYLVCNGTTFSSATYPALYNILGGTTLPDARGRYRATLNSGTGRITSGSSTGGVDGNTISASGGSQTTTLSSQNIPPTPITITDTGHLHEIRYTSAITAVAAGYNTINAGTGVSSAGPTDLGDTNTSVTGISATVGNASPTNFSNLPPTYVGGVTLILAGY